MITFKCDICNNEEQLNEDFQESKRKECWNVKNFRVKISRHHELHIDCNKCGYKIKIYA
jgi:predicted RNA-binding Zn-ribbon protein involved in translation (DUF1610 family)